MTLLLQNRQRTRKINIRELRKITIHLLENLLGRTEFELGIHLISEKEMAQINQKYLQHNGSTDVITFDYAAANDEMHGEIFICLDDAVKQAEQFRTIWQAELMRYVIHGILHLKGFDDLEPAARKKMKREEKRLLTAVASKFPLKNLQLRTPK